ncbi:MAG TPA: hypothetical protein VH853_19975 [Polyangia bacterium]|nr:hypothetical protein [Polyangia bacterium]
MAVLKGSAKRRMDDYYDRWQDWLRLGAIVGRMEARSRQPTADPEVMGDAPAARLLVATAGQGLLLVEPEGIKQLLPGKFYGLTKYRGQWYAFEKQRWHGRIVRFTLDGGWEVVMWGLSRGAHQIDILDDRLAVVDTYENRVLLFDDPARLRNAWWRSCSPAICYPDGGLRRGRKSHNYHHFNSIFATENRVYLLAHNETLKTNRPSEVWLLDRSLAVVAALPVDASNAHNVYIENESLMYCASMEGALRRDGVDMFKTDCFTRGLSVSADMIVVGGSDVSRDRTRRARADGHIWALTPELKPLACMTIRNGPVQEIRRVDARDEAMLGGSDIGIEGDG